MSRFPEHLRTGRVRADLWTRLLHALLCYRTFGLEWFLACETLLCGIWVAWPGRTFGAVTLLYHVPEILTGALLMAHGIYSSVALWTENTCRCRKAVLVGAVLWAGVATSFLIEPPRTLLPIPLAVGLSLASSWVYVRLNLRFAP